MEMITQAEAKICGLGDYPVTIVPNYEVAMSDGVKLALKVWMPFASLRGTCFDGGEFYQLYRPENPAKEEAQPVILEYLPYSKAFYTTIRDYQRHTWWCSHGYVCVRVDMRGTGDSEGLYFDEYLPQEQKDGVEIIDWLSKQTWSNGNVGMYGKSWGGFNGLQVAYEQPPALKTSISIYSTDDRYNTDCHYEGGCVLGAEMLAWSSQMFAFNARPPSPLVRPNDWKELWKKRLDSASTPWVESWLSHQTRDEYWKHGSVCEDPKRVDIPILAIGGWRDAYTDAVFRMSTSLPKFKGIIGPWPHDWPDLGKPGPAIDFVEMCLQWWDCHLKGKENGAMDVPHLRLYLQEHIEPQLYPEIRNGYWVSEDVWPPTDPERLVTLVPDNATKQLVLGVNELSNHTDMLTEEDIPFNVQSGNYVGEWLSFGASDGPGDQQCENAISLSWMTASLDKDIAILGLPEMKVQIHVKGNNKTAILAARLSHKFPDGQCTFISHGFLNLCHIAGHSQENIASLSQGQKVDAKITFQSTSYKVPAGHQLVLSISTNYWPYIWPSNEKVELACLTGEKNKTFVTKLLLPVTKAHQQSKNILFKEPKPLLMPQTSVKQAEQPFKRRLEVGLSDTESVLTMEINEDRIFNRETNMTKEGKCKSVQTISDNDPLKAKNRYAFSEKYEFDTKNDGRVAIHIDTDSEMWADQDTFYLVNKLDIKLNGDNFYERSWKKQIPRDHV